MPTASTPNTKQQAQCRCSRSKSAYTARLGTQWAYTHDHLSDTSVRISYRRRKHIHFSTALALCYMPNRKKNENGCLIKFVSSRFNMSSVIKR